MPGAADRLSAFSHHLRPRLTHEARYTLPALHQYSTFYAFSGSPACLRCMLGRRRRGLSLSRDEKSITGRRGRSGPPSAALRWPITFISAWVFVPVLHSSCSTSSLDAPSARQHVGLAPRAIIGYTVRCAPSISSCPCTGGRCEIGRGDARLCGLGLGRPRRALCAPPRPRPSLGNAAAATLALCCTWAVACTRPCGSGYVPSSRVRVCRPSASCARTADAAPCRRAAARECYRVHCRPHFEAPAFCAVIFAFLSRAGGRGILRVLCGSVALTSCHLLCRFAAQRSAPCRATRHRYSLQHSVRSPFFPSVFVPRSFVSFAATIVRRQTCAVGVRVPPSVPYRRRLHVRRAAWSRS